MEQGRRKDQIDSDEMIISISIIGAIITIVSILIYNLIV